MTEASKMQEARNEYRGMLVEGRALAAAPASKGGFNEYFSGNMALEAGKPFEALTPRLQERAAMTAIWMKNTKEWLDNMDESTRALQVGGFVDFLFPMIRAAMTNNPIMDLVSVQPMQRKIGLIFFLNYVIGQTKGARIKGDRVFDALSGFSGGSDYSDETVDGEAEVPTASSTSYTCTLTYLPVRRGTINIQVDTSGANLIARDDGNGGLVKISGTNTVSAGTIDYNTGVISITAGTSFGGTLAVECSYEYEAETSTNLPQIDVQLTSAAVSAKKRAMRIRYSQDASFDFRQEFGQDADATIVSGVADLVKAEMAREVITDLWTGAGTPVTTFSISDASNISRAEHFADILYQLNITDGQIYHDTQRAHGNWIICDVNAANVIRSIPAPVFVAAPLDQSTQGVQYIGRLNGQFDVWMDSLLANEANAAEDGNILMGHRGQDFFDAGYVYAPYQPIYTTMAITLDDFITRKGLATRYAKKMVNPRMYKKISLVA